MRIESRASTWATGRKTSSRRGSRVGWTPELSPRRRRLEGVRREQLIEANVPGSGPFHQRSPRAPESVSPYGVIVQHEESLRERSDVADLVQQSVDVVGECARDVPDPRRD